MSYAEKGKHGHEWKVKNGAAKYCKASEVFVKDSLLDAAPSKMKLILEQKSH